MKIKILKIQKSNRPIWETKLSVDGIINGKDNIPSTEQAYEMVVNIYEDERSSLPIKTISVGEKHYENNIVKYGMEALLKGVELGSMLSIAQEPGDNSVDHYKREVEAIAYAIVGRMEQDTFFNNYNPSNMRDYIEEKLLKLRDRFKIEPK